LVQDQHDPHKIVDRDIKKPALEFERSKKLEEIIPVRIATAVIVSFGVYTAIAPMDPLP